MTMYKLDTTLDEMENTRFGNKYHNFIKQMTKQTQFNEIEVSSILMLYYKFVLINGPKAKYMTKKQFSNVLLVLFNIYDIQMTGRILEQLAMGSETKNDVAPIAWIKLFSVIMSNKLEQKMKFVFSIYDRNNQGYLNREIVTLAVEKFFKGEDEDEVFELRSDMVDLIFKKFDVDKDGQISYEDFSSVISRNPLMLQFLGQCLPTTNGLTVVAYVANIWSKVLQPVKTK